VTKQLIIAAMFLGTGTLLGCGVAIAELWTRSQKVENRANDLQAELESAQGSERNLKVELREANRQRASQESDRTRTEQDRDDSLRNGEELQTELIQLRAQNDELKKVADRAVELSHQVMELEAKLASSAGKSTPFGPTRMAAVTDAKLVKVKKPQARPKTPSHPDDGGWKTVPRPN
jgi:chromosome segregation ATPase